jgi:hypothetical protein
MRSIPIVALLVGICLSAVAGCGATQAQRRQSATTAMLGGVGLAFAGLVVYASADEECDDIGGICLLDPVDENKVLGALMVASGLGISVAGVVGMPPGAGAATPTPCSRTPARGACATRPPSDRRRTP